MGIRRLLAWTGIVLVVLSSGVLGVIGWYYSDELMTPIAGGRPEPEITVQEVADGVVTLDRTPESAQPGRYAAVAEPGTYVHVGAVLSEDVDSVTRALEPPGRGTLRAGDKVTLEGAYYPQDPGEAFEFSVEDVPLEGELGVYPAYVVRRSPDRWAILVHGRGANRREGFRTVRLLHDLGLSSIVISYRNDPEAPPSPDGLYGLGATEWRDVVPAARYALDQGARELVLVGFSMGGAIAMQFLHEAPEAERVSAVVLDSPVLDWGPVLDVAAADRGLPAIVTDIAMTVSELRTEISFEALDQVSRAGELDVPVLIFHGEADSQVPIATSEAFARARPDLVTLVRVPEAEHVRAWNVDPEGYARALGEFLAA